MRRCTYRAQIDRATVVGGCECGRATVYVEVDSAATRAVFRASPLPIHALAPGPERENEFRLMLWTDSGALSGLEISWHGDTQPKELPDARAIRPFRSRQVPGHTHSVPAMLDDET